MVSGSPVGYSWRIYDYPVYHRNQTKLASIIDDALGYNSSSSKEFSNTTIKVLFYAGAQYYIAIWQGTYYPGFQSRHVGIGFEYSSEHNFQTDFHATWNLDDKPRRTKVFYTDVTKNPMPIGVKWNALVDAPLAIFSSLAPGEPVPVEQIDFDCPSEDEKTNVPFNRLQRVSVNQKLFIYYNRIRWIKILLHVIDSILSSSHFIFYGQRQSQMVWKIPCAHWVHPEVWHGIGIHFAKKDSSFLLR